MHASNNNPGETLSEEFIRVARLELKQDFAKIRKALQRLDADQFWVRTHEAENTIGNLLLHLRGNIRQWIISGIGDVADSRDRDAEFAARGGVDSAELVETLGLTLEEAFGVLDGLTAEDLLRKKRFQVYDLTVMHAIFHVVEHFGEHTGQILWAVKRITGQDLGFFNYLSPGATGGGEGRP